MVKLWDVAGRSERATLKGHKKTIRALAYSPDGTLLASASEDNTIKLWDAASGTVRATLEGHADMVTCLAFAAGARRWCRGAGMGRSSSGTSPAARSKPPSAGTPTRWPRWCWLPAGSSSRRRAMTSGSSSGSPRGRRRPPAWCSRSRNGETCSWRMPRMVSISPWAGATRSRSSTAATNNEKVTIHAPSDRVNCGTFATDGTMLATGGSGSDPVVRLWDVATGNPITVLQGKDSSISRVVFTPDGNTLAAAYDSGIIRIWDPESDAPLASIPVPATGFLALAYAPDGRSLAVGTTQGEVHLLDVAGRKVSHDQGARRGSSLARFRPTARSSRRAVWTGS